MGNQVLHTITGLGGSASKYETLTRYYQGSSATGTLLKTVAKDYSYLSPNPLERYCGPAPNFKTVINVVPIRETTTWPNGKVSKVETDYDSGFTILDQVYTTTTYPATYGKPIARREYDYGTGVAGPLVKQTLTAYKFSSDAQYKTNHLIDLVTSTTVKDGSGVQKAQTLYGYDEYGLDPSGVTMQRNTTPSTGTKRGNLTSVKRWLTGATYASTLTHYFDTGMPSQITDPGLHTIAYQYSPTFYGAYLTQVTRPTTSGVTHVTGKNYDFNTGLVSSSTDENTQVMNFTYDTMWRRIEQDLPPVGTGGQVTWAYNSSSPFKVTATQEITSLINKVDEAEVDGLGRVKQKRLISDPDGITYTDTTYDELGRIKCVSNPYRSTSEPTYGLTCYRYDALGRTTKVVPPDGTDTTNNVVTTYTDNCATSTDQAGKSRKTCADGLGRLTEVREDPSGLNYATYYDYDTLGNLTCVKQTGGNTANQSCGSAPATWRARTFSYDPLSRLVNAYNPESGTVGYSYDLDGNPLTKTSPAPNQTGSATVTITYTYDELHRLLGKAYSDSSPGVTYSYDQTSFNNLSIAFPKPRRTGMVDNATNLTAWSYDILGSIAAERKTISGITKITSYSYNLDESLALLTYPHDPADPSPRAITYAPGGAGRALSAIGSSGTQYALSAAYAPHGALSGLSLGRVNGGFSGVSSVWTYNNRLQPLNILATTGTLDLTCTPVAGKVLHLQYNFVDGNGKNDGDVQKIDNCRDTDRSQQFTYDPLNRIASAYTPNSSLWGEDFTIDAWANLTNIALHPGKIGYEPLNQSPATTQNRLPSFSSDAAGNQTSGSLSTTYIYDAENHLRSSTVASTTTTYVYDGDGNRASKSSGKMYWTGVGADILTETDAAGSPTADYVFFDAKRIARLDPPSGTVHYYFSDHLGSSSMVTDALGTMTPCGSVISGEDESDYYPYGGERVICDRLTNQDYKFTGKERDTETGLDNFGARYFGSNVGRFMTPDVPFLDQKQSDPESWNLYSYVRNIPLTLVDPDGNAHSECTPDMQGNETCTIVGDKDGERAVGIVNGQNGIVRWNADRKQWEAPEETLNDNEKIQFLADRISELTGPRSLLEVGTEALPFAMGGYSAARTAMAAPGLTTLGLSVSGEETVVIGNMGDLKDLGPGERTLDLPEKSSPKANWTQNSGKLRQAMNQGDPIRDASVGNPGADRGFLRAERNLLQSKGWTLKGEYWVPPGR